uniref:Serpin domain-containing protein n=1 Tax=Oncorhynchus tshawytscha TaxID=74940 RepID=A0AAZ3Q592_ONCTS
MRAISCCAIATVLLCVSWAAPLNGDHACWHKLAPLNADFTFALCRSLSEANTEIKNVFFSPLVIVTSLAMLSLGAKGDTHSHLYSALGYGAFTPEQVYEAYEHLNHMLGSAVALRDGFKPLAKFPEDAKHFYASEGFTIDFKNPLPRSTIAISSTSPRKWDKPFDLNQHNFSTVVMLPYKGTKSKMAQVEAFINKEYLKHVHENLFSAFDNKADFSVTHKTVLSLDEKGTETAAVTMIEIMPMSLSDTIILNRPFLLFILEDYQDIIYSEKVIKKTTVENS